MDSGIDMGVVVAIGGTILLWTLVSARLQRWNVSAPMWLVLVGFILANRPGGVDIGLGNEGLRQLAEITLALVLFGDAARVRNLDNVEPEAGRAVNVTTYPSG